MTWRKRDHDWLGPMVAFVGLVASAIVCFPNLRPLFFVVGIIALVAFAVVAFGAMAIDFYRRPATGDKISTTDGLGRSQIYQTPKDTNHGNNSTPGT